VPRATARLSQRTRLRLMAAATVGCDAVFSYVSTRNLAERFGFGWLSWLFPLCLDATAAVGMELWLSRSPAQRPAKWLALAAIALSLAANFIDWRLAQNSWGSAVLGAVPPAMLALQLLVLHQHESGQPRPRRATRPGSRPRAGTPRRHGSGPKPAVPDADLLAQMRQVERDGGRLSKRFVMTTYHVGDGRALRLLAAHHNTSADVKPPAHANGAVLR
jgi:Protein of unknown function (DUF2637)